MASPKRKATVDGNHVLYHYLEKDLKDRDIWLFQMLASKLFTSLGIWFSPETYSRCPILVPYAVRDASCRHSGPDGADEWGSANGCGYLRDDNSLVKNLPRSLRVRSPDNPLYHGKTLGNGFVAAHVWRNLAPNSGAARSTLDAETNTFIPNLVWLPVQVAKLTDREGSFAQTYMQAVAMKIYRHIEVPPPMKAIIDRAWAKLPVPAGIPESGLPDPSQLAFFEDSERFRASRAATIREVATAIESVTKGKPLIEKVVSSRYTASLPRISAEKLQPVCEQLRAYVQAIDTVSIGTSD